VYEISRPTGDKWIERALAEGMQALAERSRAPHRHANATAREFVEMIVQTKLAHQNFGPKKVLDCLRRRTRAGHGLPTAPPAKYSNAPAWCTAPRAPSSLSGQARRLPHVRT